MPGILYLYLSTISFFLFSALNTSQHQINVRFLVNVINSWPLKATLILIKPLQGEYDGELVFFTADVLIYYGEKTLVLLVTPTMALFGWNVPFSQQHHDLGPGTAEWILPTVIFYYLHLCFFFLFFFH